MADYACSLCSLSTLFTRIPRECLALQTCAILGHSRYTASFFIANHPSVRHTSHPLILITHLLCPPIISPSHTEYCLNRSIASMDLFHLLANNNLGFRVPGGNSSILGTSGNYVLLCHLDLGDSSVHCVIQTTFPATFHVDPAYCFFFFSTIKISKTERLHAVTRTMWIETYVD